MCMPCASRPLLTPSECNAMDAGPYLVVGAVVFGSLLMAFVGFVLHADLRSRKKPDPLQEYFDSIGMPTDKRGHWF